MKQNLKQTARKRLAAMALFLLICLPFSLAQAQTVKVNGRVTDDLNEPMIGVSIFEKGTTNGVITDMDGNYSLSVKEGATIVYSYIGYLTQEKKAVAGVMNVILKEDTKTLDEVVVVGYGVQKKSSLTGAVSSVNQKIWKHVPLPVLSRHCRVRLPVCRCSVHRPNRVLLRRYVSVE